MAGVLQSCSPYCLAFAAILPAGSVRTFAQATPPPEISQLEQKLADARAAGDQALEAQQLLSLSSLYSNAGQTQKALESCQQADPLVRATGTAEAKAAAISRVGDCYRVLNQNQKALDTYQAALDLAVASHDDAGQAVACYGLGWTSGNMGQNQTALKDYDRALLIARKLSDKGLQAKVLRRTGVAYAILGDQTKALDFYRQALQLFVELGDTSGQADTLNGIGLAYNTLNQKKEALDAYNQALPLYRNLQNHGLEAVVLVRIGEVYFSTSEFQKSADDYSQALALYRTLGNKSGEADTLNHLGTAFWSLGKHETALDYYNQTLALNRQLGDRSGEARTLNNMGLVYSDTGDQHKALDLYSQSLAIRRELSDRRGEAYSLFAMGHAYSELAQQQKALDFYNQTLPILEELGNKGLEALTLAGIGSSYTDLGQPQKALEANAKALPLQREVGDRSGQSITLTNMGAAYSALGEIEKSLDALTQALDMEKAIDFASGEERTLTDMGVLYWSLGQNQKALDFYNQALPIERQVGDRLAEASTLTYIGQISSNAGDGKLALQSYNQGLQLQRQIGDRKGESLTLNAIGVTYSDLGRQTEALASLYQALAIRRDIGDRNGEAVTLTHIGTALSDLNRPDVALMGLTAGLALATDLRDPDAEGLANVEMMRFFSKQNRPELAILFGMNAVNCYQQMRKNITGLSKELQAGFAQSKSSTYRELAELLIQADRLGEAEQVLDLLKEQELKEIVRGGGDAAAKVEPLKLSAQQQKALGELAVPEKMAASLTPLAVEQSALSAKTPRTPVDDARLKTLKATIDHQSGEIAAYYKNKIAAEMNQPGGPATPAAARAEEGTQSYLQNTLASLGPDVIGIRILFGDQHAYAIVVTAHTRQKFELKATPQDLRTQVLRVRDDLRLPDSDPRPELQTLYTMVVGPLDGVLGRLERASPNAGHAPTLLWSLDGVLRYIPMAALYDGHHYLLERFNNVLFTPNSYGHMTASAKPAAARDVLAMGLSRSYGGMPALPGVIQELDAIVHDPVVPDSHGPMQGRLLPNDQFTLAALEEELHTGNPFSVVHIASHFGVDGSATGEPFLLLGGETSGSATGYKLTLSTLQTSSLSFHGTRLLTLSACSTASDYRTRNGVEMDSLGMVAQQKDAAAVLATLWSVNDASTSLLMSDFYRRWATTPGIQKIEALRQSQLAMLNGKLQPMGATYDLSHPYYWAPFVLIGNFR